MYKADLIYEVCYSDYLLNSNAGVGRAARYRALDLPCRHFGAASYQLMQQPPRCLVAQTEDPRNVDHARVVHRRTPRVVEVVLRRPWTLGHLDRPLCWARQAVAWKLSTYGYHCIQN